MQGPSQSWLDHMADRATKFFEQAGSIIDKFIDGFDKVMTKAINEGGLADLASKVTSGLGNTVNKIGDSGFTPFPGGAKSDPTPAQAQAVAIETPAMPENVQHAQHAARTALSGVSMPTLQVANVDMGQAVSPAATPGIGYGGHAQGMAI
jgi:hypothetical protein